MALQPSSLNPFMASTRRVQWELVLGGAGLADHMDGTLDAALKAGAQVVVAASLHRMLASDS